MECEGKELGPDCLKCVSRGEATMYPLRDAFVTDCKKECDGLKKE